MPAFVDTHHLVIIFILYREGPRKNRGRQHKLAACCTPKDVGSTDLVETYRTPIVDPGSLTSSVDSAGQISLELRWEVLGFGVPDASCETEEALVGDVHVVIVLN